METSILFFFRVIKGTRVYLGRVREFSTQLRRKLCASLSSRHPALPSESARFRTASSDRAVRRGAVITAVSSRIHQLSMTRRHESAAPGHSLRDGKRRRCRRIAHYIIRAGFPESARCSILVSGSNLH